MYYNWLILIGKNQVWVDAWQYENRKDHFGCTLGHNLFFEVSALLDVKHCPKLQSCAISRIINDVTLRKW